MSDSIVPFFLRGQELAQGNLEYSSSGGISFRYPDPTACFERIVLSDPVDLQRDFDGVRVRDVIAFLAEVGKRLDPARNARMQQAMEFTKGYSTLPASIIEGSYRLLPVVFSRMALTALVEGEIGSRYLDGWVEMTYAQQIARVRAFGCRTLHFISGNVPVVAALSIARAALIKSDNILKVPVNDPFTSQVILSAMRDVDASFPVVRHFSAVFWDSRLHAALERELVSPRYLEKIISWGGALGGVNSTLSHGELSSVGLDVLDLGPKLSISVLGAQAFRDRATMDQVAALAARDSAAFNQESCGASRYHYVQASPERAVEYARLLYGHMQNQPPDISTHPTSFPLDLAEQLDTLHLMEDWYHVEGGSDGEGAVVVCRESDVGVDFVPTHKVVVVIPMADFDDLTIPSSTQTVGVYPEDLRERLHDRLIAQGACRFVSLGHTLDYAAGGPFNTFRIMSRAVRWGLDERQPRIKLLFYLRKALQIGFSKLGLR
jgi:hypothetical protein